jgi:hypothetical protein
MGALADADDEPGVGVCGAVGTSDEVVSLQNQRAILTKAAAVMARIVTEYTAAITNDDNITHEFLESSLSSAVSETPFMRSRVLDLSGVCRGRYPPLFTLE